MRFLKASAVGVVVAMVCGVVWTLAAMLFPIGWQMWQARNQGGGVGASSVGSGSALLAALIGFVLGFAWTLRRQSGASR